MKTKILIVDDSRIFRSSIEDSLAGETDIEVIGSVRNGVKALEFIESHRPDLVTLDVEMPELDGLKTLKAIQENNAAHPDIPAIGVIMLSSFTKKGVDITIQALEDGAFDFIAKPEKQNPAENIEILRRQLIVKIRYFASRRIHSHSERIQKKEQAESPLPARSVKPFSDTSKIRAILIGVSTGGPRALSDMLPLLCQKTDLPILIVQHMPPTFTCSLAQSLNSRCGHTVTEAKNNDIVSPNHAYIAPGGNHMLVRRNNSDVMIFINSQPPESGCRPSVDVLFRSSAAVYGENVIAIILTGMGIDGTKGAGALRRAGAYVIAQDEETSVVWGMPGSAHAAGYVNEVLPLGKIPEAVAVIIHKANKKDMAHGNLQTGV